MRRLSSPSIFTVVFAAAALLIGRGTEGAELRPETVKAWAEYVRLTEARIAAELHSKPGFLVLDFLPPADGVGAREAIRKGQVFVRRLETRNEEGREIEIPKGMVHHWMAGILIRGVRVDDVLEWIQTYSDFHKYFKDVEESRLISRDGDVFRIHLKIRAKRFTSAYFHTEHLVTYRHHDPGRASSRSEATRIVQLDDPGTPTERERPEGRDSGYMWRWNSYWRFKQEPGGAVVECESLSLSRGIPPIFAWFIKPLVTKVPKEALENTLKAMRQALASPVRKATPAASYPPGLSEIWSRTVPASHPRTRMAARTPDHHSGRVPGWAHASR